VSESAFLQVQTVGGRVVATVACEKLGARESQVLETELRALGPKSAWKMAVDLGAVTVMASMGLGMLVSVHKACKENRGALAVYGVRPEILEVLKVTHLHRVLQIVDSAQAAQKIIQ